jgi:16S rRNA (adenine1518-N6/adenine1519-N6)-dimethyltransferase
MRARKRFGQHFLEQAWADRLIAAIAPSPDDTIVEIGPGRGALTLPLARVVRRVVAIEIDRDLVAWLAPRLPSNVTLVEGDVLATPLDSLTPPEIPLSRVRVVGNLPYNISSPIIFRLLQRHRETGAFRDACVMLQREVADRIAAKPGSKAYGILSVAVQMDAQVSHVLALPPAAFRPAPAVSSSVIRLTFREPAAEVDDRDAFDGMVRAIFAHRRKTLLNALKSFAGTVGADVREVLEESGIDGRRRPETLQLTELAGLANRLGARGRTPVL